MPYRSWFIGASPASTQARESIAGFALRNSAHQNLYLVLTAIVQERNLVAGQDLAVQHHLPHAPVDTGCIVRADLENGFALAVRHLVTRPTKPGKVADKPAQAAQPTGLWVFTPRP
jgi:hypothetical protein